MAFTDEPGLRPAIIDASGQHTHDEIEHAASRVAAALAARRGDLAEARIAFLIPPGFEFAATLEGVWRAGGVAVPLAVTDPAAEIDYIIRDAAVETIVTGQDLAGAIGPLAAAAGVSLRTTGDLLSEPPSSLDAISPNRRALMVYSSGTTSRPKGVVTTHANITAQVASLLEAWEWRAADRLLLVLPLHHVHGLINGLVSARRAGACCEMPARFDPTATWDRLASGEITVFTAVPTIYNRLIARWESASEEVRLAWSEGTRRVRLMLAGSAALPTPVLAHWRAITGQVLLERYGLTEAGMVLGNPLHGERRPGFVGTPFPGVEVRLVDEAGQVVPPGTAGELEVRSGGVFLEYWRQPDLTRAALRDGWLRTADVAVVENGAYRLLGRLSVDIIKSGGYKISALEVEDALRAHPAVVDAAVVGVADPTWGERVCAAIVLRGDAAPSPDDLQAWVKTRLSPHKVPKTVRSVPALPRNAMGKVVKPCLTAWFE